MQTDKADDIKERVTVELFSDTAVMKKGRSCLKMAFDPVYSIAYSR